MMYYTGRSGTNRRHVSSQLVMHFCLYRLHLLWWFCSSSLPLLLCAAPFSAANRIGRLLLYLVERLGNVVKPVQIIRIHHTSRILGCPGERRSIGRPLPPGMCAKCNPPGNPPFCENYGCADPPVGVIDDKEPAMRGSESDTVADNRADLLSDKASKLAHVRMEKRKVTKSSKKCKRCGVLKKCGIPPVCGEYGVSETGLMGIPTKCGCKEVRGTLPNCGAFGCEGEEPPLPPPPPPMDSAPVIKKEEIQRSILRNKFKPETWYYDRSVAKLCKNGVK